MFFKISSNLPLRLFCLCLFTVVFFACAKDESDEPEMSNSVSLYFEEKDGPTELEIPNFGRLSVDRTIFEDQVPNPIPYYGWFLESTKSTISMSNPSTYWLYKDTQWRMSFQFGNNGIISNNGFHVFLRIPIPDSNNEDNNLNYNYCYVEFSPIVNGSTYTSIKGDQFIGLNVKYKLLDTPPLFVANGQEPD